jgi:PAS domain-containing protein
MDGESVSEFGAILMTAMQEVRRELDSVREEIGPEISARLAGAKDELAAIYDEMHQQQQEIRALLTEAGSSRAGLLRRFLATLPLATLLTTSSGKIVDANGAAHAVLRMPTGTLTGKPIFAYIAQSDRRDLRSALSRACVDDELRQVTAQLTPRHATAVQTYFAVVRELDEQVAAVTAETPGPLSAGAESVGDAETPAGAPADFDPAATLVRWVILPDYASVDGPPSHVQLEALTRLCRLGADAGELHSTLKHVVKLCVQALIDADDVSLLVGDPLEPTMTVASSALAQHLDGLQHSRAGGPSFDAYRSRRPIALDGDAVTEHQGLADDAEARTVHSLLTVPLVTDEMPTGVMTVYATSERSVATLNALRQVMPFVEAAQTLIRDTRAHEEMRRTQEQLEAALTSRAVIDQAKGMIMISLKCNADEAFGHLVRMSSTRHEKVRDVAQSMVSDVLTKRSRLLANSSE